MRPRAVQVAVGVPVAAAVAVATERTYAQMPWWLALGPALLAGAIIGAIVVLAKKSLRRQGDEHRPKWLQHAEPLLMGGFIGGFGTQLQDHLSHSYPAAPWWMTYATAIMACLVVLSPLDILIFYYLRRWRRRHEQSPGTAGPGYVDPTTASNL